MIIVVINIISSILLFLFVYIIIISKLHASIGIVLISYDTVTSNERVKGITVVLFIV